VSRQFFTATETEAALLLERKERMSSKNRYLPVHDGYHAVFHMQVLKMAGAAQYLPGSSMVYPHQGSCWRQL
jgi:hypothetical protein